MFSLIANYFLLWCEMLKICWGFTGISFSFSLRILGCLSSGTIPSELQRDITNQGQVLCQFPELKIPKLYGKCKFECHTYWRWRQFCFLHSELTHTSFTIASQFREMNFLLFCQCSHWPELTLFAVIFFMSPACKISRPYLIVFLKHLPTYLKGRVRDRYRTRDR